VTRLARVVFVLLVGATFAAFFAAQRIKGEPAVARVRSLAPVFSPNGDRVKDVNAFYVELRERSEISVDVVDTAGDRVRRLAEDATVSPSEALHLRWNGRTDDGRRVGDGRYRVRVTLRREGRSVVVPRTTLVDTRAPRPRVKSVTPGAIVGPEPGPIDIEVGSISRRLVKRAQIWRTDGGAPRKVADLPKVANTRTLRWDGRVAGKPAPPGIYLVRLIARDRAGNRGVVPYRMPPERGESRGNPGITVRAIAAEMPPRPVTSGERLRVNVDARRRPYRWSLRRAGSPRPVAAGRESAGAPVELTAPGGDSGLYVLRMRAGKQATNVPVLVQSRERARMLVVLPAITWIGTDEADENEDGVPDTLEAGTRVPWPRVMEHGLPADLLYRVAPLLVYLDRAHIRYDLTSDLDLALSTGPRASDRTGVLLAGSERWVSREYARRLRRYVLDGGRLAIFGTDSLRRGVTLLRNEAGTAGRLVRPTQPSHQDPFGTRFEDVRRTPKPVTLALIGGEPGYGLLEGLDTGLSGFSVLEESEPPAAGRGTLLAALGVETAPAVEDQDVPEELPPPARPAVVATQVGKGVMIRVGLPEWSGRLQDRQVAQVTHNVADILRKLKPKIRSVPRPR
jgi:N,N-dimethylformamidase beta subunit-like, C-terminal